MSNLELFEAGEENFLVRFISTDESWVHHNQPETKEQSKQRRHTSSLSLKKINVIPSAGKVMTSVFFFYSQGILLINYLENCHTVTGLYYSPQLKRLRKAIKVKGQECSPYESFFYHNSAPAYTSVSAMATIRDCGYELVPYPPYSSDVAPANFYPFPKMTMPCHVNILLVAMTSQTL